MSKSSCEKFDTQHFLAYSYDFNFGGMFMKQMINIAQMLGLQLVAEIDQAWPNYPGAVSWWCLATPRPPFIEKL